MKRIVLIILAATLSLAVQAATPSYFNVKEFGAKGDGRHVDSEAVNKAIESAAAKGGGTIYFPAGTYLSYSIRMKDNIRLYLDRGAVIKAAVPTEKQGYDIAEPNGSRYQDFGHSHWRNSLIWGIGLHDISIEGPGCIDGTDALSRGLENADGPVAKANKAIALKECRNVTISDITMLMCGHFALLLTGVDNLTIDNVTADTNRDAFDIDCCRNVQISNCNVNTLCDDAIVLKSSYALGYAKSTENVTITNCLVSGYDPGTFWNGTFTKDIAAAPDKDGPTGRIKFGTESNGGFRNITISNCVFDHCRGLALETVDGAVIEDINVSNISMREIFNSPFYIRLGNRARGPEGMPFSVIRRVNISNVTVKEADCRYASMVFGLEGHMIEDITFSNIFIQYKGGYSMDDVVKQTNANLFFNKNLKDPGRQPYDIPQQAKGYPEPSSHGVLPTYGLFVSHARNVKFNNIEFQTIDPDSRPAVLLMDVEGAEFNGIRLPENDAPFFILKDVRDFRLDRFNGNGCKTIEKAEDASITQIATF